MGPLSLLKIFTLKVATPGISLMKMSLYNLLHKQFSQCIKLFCKLVFLLREKMMKKIIKLFLHKWKSLRC